MRYTLEQTLAWLNQAVAERGADFNYRQAYYHASDACFYVEDNGDGTSEPGCIAGYVFALAGIPPAELRAEEGASAYSAAGRLGFALPARWALDRAQKVQDAGGTWGEALVAAHEKGCHE